MEIPKGMKAEDNECLILNKTIYGLVQSAREFYNKLVSALKDCGFKASSVDPCLWMKYSNHGIVLIAIYVDDCLMVRRESDINDVIEKMKNYDFGLKVEHNLTDYLSCRIFVNYEKNPTFVMQPHLIKNLEDEFSEEVNNLSNYGTPGTPRFKIVRPNDDVEKIDSKLQARYRSGVGMLLFLIKYSRPDLANVVRELSKCMDGASHAAYKEMLRVMKFVLETKEYCLKMQPIEEAKNWNLVTYCDSDCAGDAETRISVTGFIIYLLGVPSCWRSKGQKSVTLSSSEAEYIAISEAVKEIRFIYYLLDSIGIKVELPIVVRCDNVGANFMAENSSSGVRTRYIDTRYHFIREHIEDGFIKIVFVRSCENVGDIFTQNVNKEIYDKHVSKFLGKVNDDSDVEYWR
jgi:Reverse transcriptase (RNA-dependent DNA polymerase)